jgi:hypothetical protein
MAARINGGCGGGGSQDRDGVEADDPCRFVIVLKKAGQEPEREQFEEGAEEGNVDEAVC